MPIEVELPGGDIVEFPDGTDNATMERALRQHAEMAPRPKADFSGVRAKVDSTTFRQQPKPRSPGDELLRSFGLGARSMIRGGADLVGIVADPFIHGANWMGEKDPTTKTLITGQPERRWERQATMREGADRLSDILGLPLPETPVERVSSGITSAVTGGGGMLGLGRGLIGQANPLVNYLGSQLSSMPGRQIAGAVLGSGAAETTREAGGGPGAQVAAGLIGGLTPTVGGSAAAMGLRGLMRGGEEGRQGVRRTLADFAQLGVTPSVGQATQGRTARGLESLLAGGPTSSGVVGDFAERQQDQIRSGLGDMADGMYRNASAERAGRAVERGAQTFANTTKATRAALYGKVDALLPERTPVGLTRTQQALTDLTTVNPNAPATTAALINPKISALARNVAADLAQAEGGLPYATVKDIRTRIGNELSDFSLTTDKPTAEYKRLYAALSQDMEEAARLQGPAAEQAMRRANSYFKASAERLETLERVVDKNGGPERVYAAVMSGTRDGGTTLRKVMQSLDSEGRRAITAAVVKRMGLDTPGAQNAAGDAFSSHKFLTNWNQLSGEAKKALFDRHGPRFTQDMDRLARVADNLKAGSKVYANPSGTANRTAGIAYWGTLGGSLLMGNWAGASAAASGGATANAMARAMTNPKFVHWLARATELPTGAAASQIPVLRGMAQDDPDVGLIADELERSTAN